MIPWPKQCVRRAKERLPLQGIGVPAAVVSGLSAAHTAQGSESGTKTLAGGPEGWPCQLSEWSLCFGIAGMRAETGSIVTGYQRDRLSHQCCGQKSHLLWLGHVNDVLSMGGGWVGLMTLMMTVCNLLTVALVACCHPWIQGMSECYSTKS